MKTPLLYQDPKVAIHLYRRAHSQSCRRPLPRRHYPRQNRVSLILTIALLTGLILLITSCSGSDAPQHTATSNIAPWIFIGTAWIGLIYLAWQSDRTQRRVNTQHKIITRSK